MARRHRIELLPHGREINASSGENVLESLMANNIFLRADCGGKGRCGKCRVEAIDESGQAVAREACTLTVEGDLRLVIPEESLLSAHIIDKAPANLPASFASEARQSPADIVPGIAVDLGTTTIAVYLVDMAKKIVISSVAVKNPQALYGDDVMSRIGQIGDGPEKLRRLQQLVVKAIEWGIRALLAGTELPAERLAKMVAVGNPTMIHILLGVSPESIGFSPFTPQFYEARQTEAVSLGFAFPRLIVQTLPQVGGFLGGDILAAALATELSAQPPGTLLIDLGTNGELVLKGPDGVYATSCATGPAFEGAALSCGMQAIPGAIDKVSISGPDFDPEYSMVKKNGGVPIRPSGLCGSGVISAVSAMLRTGIIGAGGLFNRTVSIRGLLEAADSGRRYLIVPADRTAYGREIAISQKDIRAVQLGKGALSTGILFLMRAAGITALHRVLIAGAFGSYLDKEDMTALGMIPAIDPRQIQVVGNSAGAGAIMALCDEKHLLEAQSLSGGMKVVELAANSEFQNTFVHNLSFPPQFQYQKANSKKYRQNP